MVSECIIRFALPVELRFHSQPLVMSLPEGVFEFTWDEDYNLTWKGPVAIQRDYIHGLFNLYAKGRLDAYMATPVIEVAPSPIKPRRKVARLR